MKNMYGRRPQIPLKRLYGGSRRADKREREVEN